MPPKSTRTQPAKPNTVKSKKPSATPKATSGRSSSKNQELALNTRGHRKTQSASPQKTKNPSQPGQPTISTRELQVGDPAPPFSLPDDTGHMVTLSELHGKKVVVYFYPKDDTPGCTTEACSFRDGMQELRKSGAVVVGVSADSVSSHRKFSEKFHLNFPLLSDESKAVIQAYGVWKEKSLYGRKFMGIERTTVLINEDGTIRRVFSKVKVNGHFSEVLQALG
jgi:thioredoxin-dependent peroxiredoxin